MSSLAHAIVYRRRARYLPEYAGTGWLFILVYPLTCNPHMFCGSTIACRGCLRHAFSFYGYELLETVKENLLTSMVIAAVNALKGINFFRYRYSAQKCGQSKIQISCRYHPELSWKLHNAMNIIERYVPFRKLVSAVGARISIPRRDLSEICFFPSI